MKELIEACEALANFRGVVIGAAQSFCGYEGAVVVYDEDTNAVTMFRFELEDGLRETADHWAHTSTKPFTTGAKAALRYLGTMWD
jgi:hypothetical protein